MFRTRIFLHAHILRITLLTVILLLSTSDTLAQQLSWALYTRDCSEAAATAEHIRPAGDRGVYYFGQRTIQGCPSIRLAGCNDQDVRFYPDPGPTPLEPLDCDPAQSGCGRQLASMTAEPWIHIVDYLTWHGKSVDAVVRGSTDPRIKTLIAPLESHFQHLGGVVDADVIFPYADLAEAIDHGNTLPPLVTNMSFGRRHDDTGGDARDISCVEQACGPGALSCQIAHLLDHITRARPDGTRTVAVAAHGNDNLALTPSALEDVVSVGMLDLTRLGAGVALPAWETPAPVDALMPGNGLCVELQTRQDPDGQPDKIQTPLPGGSSYSAALYTGMIAEQLLHDADAVLDRIDQGPLWSPRRTCSDDSCPFVLDHGGTLFPGLTGNGGERIWETLFDDPADCGVLAGYSLFARLVSPGIGPYGYPTLPELRSTHRPAPEPNSCVPCAACCQYFPWQQPGTLAATVQGARGARTSVTISLEIDLHSTWMIDQDLTLEELYLRLGSETRLIELKAPVLAEIASGNVGFLNVEGAFSNLDMSTQPSLVSVLSWDDPDGDKERFRRSTPMILRP